MPDERERDAAATTPADVLTGTVEDVQRRLREEEQRYLRLLAEFDTFRRRASRDHAAAVAQGRVEALRPLLTVLDALDEALAAGSTDARFYDGILAIERLFVSTLGGLGVEPIDSAAGAPLDPHLHHAIATAPAEGVAPGTIVRTASRGWRIAGQLIRPAQVVVAAVEEPEDVR